MLKSFLPSAKSSTGFTLIELLIVIAIIGILISIGLTAFSRAQTQARDGQRKADLQNIGGALEQYYSDYNVYPANLTLLTSAPDGQVYLRALPRNPSDSTADVWDTWDHYASGQAYCLAVDLEITPSPLTACNGTDYEFVVSPLN